MNENRRSNCLEKALNAKRTEEDSRKEFWDYIYEKAKDDPIFYQAATLRGKIPDEEIVFRIVRAVVEAKEVYQKALTDYQTFYPNPPMMREKK